MSTFKMKRMVQVWWFEEVEIPDVCPLCKRDTVDRLSAEVAFTLLGAAEFDRTDPRWATNGIFTVDHDFDGAPIESTSALQAFCECGHQFFEDEAVRVQSPSNINRLKEVMAVMQDEAKGRGEEV